MTGPAKLRILHADDDETFRLLVERVFSSDPHLAAHCDLKLVDDGSVVVDYIAGKGDFADRWQFPLPHLIVLDQRMVNMDGLEALRLIKQLPAGQSIPTFVFSTSAQGSLVEDCYRLGAAFCAAKPLDFARLAPTLRIVVDFAINVLELPHHHP